MTSPTTAVVERPVEHLLGWDAIEFWVGNARAFSGFLMSGFGFVCTDYAGPETGVSDRVSYVLRQGEITFVVTAALEPESEIAAHVKDHGDGVRDLRWRVDDASSVFESAVVRGATPAHEPETLALPDGALVQSSIAIYGETRHTFVERSMNLSSFAPGFARTSLLQSPPGPIVGLERIDHVVGNVEEGRLESWVRFYKDVFGFSTLVEYDESQIATQYSALRSKVVWDGQAIVLPLNEPAEGLRKSQIAEYLDCYRGPGVQHIALHTADIVASVGALRARGVRFMEVPDTYYEDAKARLSGIDVPWADLERLSILVDANEEGVLLQIFTETLTDRPTIFVEIIERRGCRGFGEGNFKALFEAIEREQERRGHL